MRTFSIADDWARLKQDAGGGELGLASMELDARAPAGRLRLAIGPDGGLLLLAPVSSPASPGSLPQADGLHVSEVILRGEGRSQRFLQLACCDTALEAVFVDVVAQVACRVAEGAAPLEAMETTVSDYRALLRRATDTAIGEQRLIGLIGELRVLVRLMEINASAWRSWAPVAGRHDFRAGDYALECKTTLRSAGRRVEISSLEQLEEPAGGHLHIVLQVLERDIDGPLGLSSLGRRALSMAGGAAELEDLLRDVGWSPDVSDSEPRFSLYEEAAWKVVEGFPRLVPGMLDGGQLPAGVSALNYGLDLAAASDFVSSENEARQHEERLANAASPLR